MKNFTDYQFTPYSRCLTIIAISIIITLTFGYYSYIKPLQTKLQNILQQQTNIQMQIHTKQQQIQKLSHWQKKWQHSKNKSPLLTIQTTQQLTTATILKNIASIIAESKLTPIAIQPQLSGDNNKIHTPNFVTQNYNFTATGNYQQILNFFIAIHNSSQLIQVTNFSIKQLNQPTYDKTNFTSLLLFNAYVQILSVKHQKHHDKITVAHNPFINDGNTITLPLNTWDSKELQFLGTIKTQTDHKTWNIISDPTGQLHVQ